MTGVLPDLLAPEMACVICGTAAGAASARIGGYYAGPGNVFWRVLFEAGFTDRLLAPDEFRLLPGYGIGLTDVAKAASGNDRELADSDFDREALMRRVARFSPAVLAFNGKKAASAALALPTQDVGYGLYGMTLGASKIFVLPSTSGAARRYWNAGPWHELAELAGFTAVAPSP